ncbi:MAG: glycosyl hydrolase [Myxococcaceae bacterium]|nr:glycosyl hydrolase [Myxococcaceae bacterium]
MNARTLVAGAIFITLFTPRTAPGQTPARSMTQLPSSNGHCAVMVDLTTAKVTHFREHLPATEEPLLDAQGNEVWNGNQPQAVKTRDLLYDAYVGARVNGSQQWLTTVPVDGANSGYAPWTPGVLGGTGIVTLTQKVGPLEIVTWVFAPRGLPRAGFVLAARVRNTGTAPATGVSLFTLHNFHLGFGRPGVTADIGESGETVVIDTNGHTDVLERAFAGVIAVRALAPPTHVAAWNEASLPSENGFLIVQGGGTADLPDSSGTLPTANGWAHAFQFDVGTLDVGAEAWAGVAIAHDPDPFAAASAQGALDAWLEGRGVRQVVEDELSAWSAFQSALRLPDGLSAEETTLTRQSAVVLEMAQVRDSEAFLREWLTIDGEPRFTRFRNVDGGSNALPARVRHRGFGAVLASLPPGEWTYAWPRDGAYAVAAMAALGMKDEAADALRFYLQADSGRLQNWNELKPYAMPPYLISLTRYHGFGVEETDFNDFGPNLEFDGFGLYLWALRSYERATGDLTLAENAWPEIATKVADPIVALVDPATGLLRPDSSIWETHWNGRQRTWTYTNITAVRGLCDAAEIAERLGDEANATKYRSTALAVRAAIAARLTDPNGALGSNLEELRVGAGYDDAAVLEAIAFGLFDPHGRIAQATLDRIDLKLRTPAGKGWARNDDAVDHPGATDWSPWGSDYDRAEWVVTDLRGAIAMERAGRPTRAKELRDWVLTQSNANFGALSETYDPDTGAYKFNAPMIGFGAGAWVLAMAERAAPTEPACGAYFDEHVPTDAGTSSPDAGIRDAGSPDAGAGADGGAGPGSEALSCGCTGSVDALSVVALLLAVLVWRLRTAHVR